MQWSEDGIVLGARQHGETDVILEVMTRGHGRHLGLVHGGGSRRQRPVLQPGNTLSLTWRARLDEHLGHFRVEPVRERASAIMASPSATFGVQTLAAHLRLLPERDPHPRLYEALAVVADHLSEPRRAGELMIRFELLLLEELGFGLDLSRCAATGVEADLVYVSPRSGRAVSEGAGAPYAERLLRLPDFLRDGPGAAPPDAQALEDGFRLTGFFLDRHGMAPHGLPGGEAREGFVRAVLREAG